MNYKKITISLFLFLSCANKNKDKKEDNTNENLHVYYHLDEETEYHQNFKDKLDKLTNKAQFSGLKNI